MPAQCFFTLNRQSVSTLVCAGLGGMAAFSGKPGYTNDPDKATAVDRGPLPPGRYYIVSRQSGGRLGWLRDWVKDHVSHVQHDQWFALYRNDGVIDDWTFVNGVRRGNFRIHPNGRFGVSEGCITLTHPASFDRLRAFLLSQPPAKIPGTNITYFGTVDVR
ncbi:DUF2778 domain-containing protein [Burkholderia mayonis]|uniref:Tlde1 domain-containing protein n=1 Tax=Burkholderia mayonis TaxID=1385591 RepID=A0A1B4G179_9BURK|nr:DUF2778 domain-containing protein [Burkholderia mayonis]AOJ09648.1 hypothetical protein WS71_20260 [Burkholderia mayonis]KVE52269.1 hypothetical protein WS71_10085 [Burkholderia mayonis]